MTYNTRDMENSTIECLKTRRSIKSYKPDAVPSDEQIGQILEAGMNAPTGRGAQSPIIIAVTDKSTRDRLSEMNAAVLGSSGDPFYGAPVVLAVLADRTVPTHIYDGALVMGNLMNAAHALGLGSCWIHRAREVFGSEEGKAMLRQWGIEGDYEGIGHCVLGYPADGQPKAAQPRKPDYVKWVRGSREAQAE